MSLPEILSLGVAQYNSRIYDLRKSGVHIENRVETVAGIRHSWFRLVESHTQDDGEPDWYVRTTGKPRPTDTPTVCGPLFKQGNL